MTGESDHWQRHRVSTEHFIEVGEHLNDFVDVPVSPLVEEFARVIVAPWQAMYADSGLAFAAVPSEMIRNTLNFLTLIRSKGQEHAELLPYAPLDLLDITDSQLKELYCAVPVIMRAGYPADFAEAVEAGWDKILKYWGYKEDLPSKIVNEIEPITITITTAEQAKLLIIDSAAEILTNLDWRWALGGDIEDEKIARLFNGLLPRVLTENVITPVLGVFDNEHDADALRSMSAHQKVALNDRQTLALLLDSIDPADATMVRDGLCLYVADDVGEYFGVDIAAGKLLMTNPGLGQAALRNMGYLFNNPSD